jgi:hypothetical protein
LAAAIFGIRRSMAQSRTTPMSDGNDDYVYDEASGEGRPASEIAAERRRPRKFATPTAMFSPTAIPWC